MKRGRLTAIAGALGLLAWLGSSGVAAQADTSISDSTFNAMVSTYTYLAQVRGGQTFCVANPSGSTPCPVTTQTSVDQNNVAVCVENTSTQPAAEDCSITQTNVTGTNVAIVIQIVNQRTGPTQDATQQATIKQDNMSGHNFAAVLQFVKQSTSADGTQKQTNGQFATIDQNPTTLLTATGRNFALLGESSRQYGQSESASSQTQISNQDVSDFAHHINQHSSGVSRTIARQSQVQQLVGSGPQTQAVDPRCCSTQESNPADTFDIGQSVSQMGNPSANQQAVTVGECHTSGNCTVAQSTQQNNASATNSCSGPNCQVFITCTSSAEGGACTAPPPCTGFECSPPPPCLPIVCPPSTTIGLASFRSRAIAMAYRGSSLRLATRVPRSAASAALLT